MTLPPRALRTVSRRLLYGKFLGDHICLQCRRTLSSAALRREDGGLSGARGSRRVSLVFPTTPRLLQKRTYSTIFDLLKEEMKNPPIEAHKQNPAIPVLATLCRYLDEEIGFEPTTPELLKAFNLIVHDQPRRTLLRDEGNCYGLIRLLETLQQKNETHLLPQEDLIAAMKALQQADHEFAVPLAGMLLDRVRDSEDIEALRSGFEAVVITLATQGEYDKALDFLVSGITEYEGKDVINDQHWYLLLETAVKQENVDGANKVIVRWKQLGYPMNSRLYDSLIQLHLQLSDPAVGKTHWEAMLKAGIRPSLQTCERIFDYWLKANKSRESKLWMDEVWKHIETAEMIKYEKAVTKPTTKVTSEDSGPEEVELDEELPIEVERELLKLKRRLSEGESAENLTSSLINIKDASGEIVDLQPNMINELIEFAISTNDMKAAQLLHMFSERAGLQGNRRSQLLLVRLRGIAGDADGAVSALDNLKYFEAEDAEEGSEALDVMRIMAKNPKTNSTVIKHIYDDIIKRRILIDAETLCILLDYHVRQSPMQTVANVLTREVNSYTMADRLKVIRVIGNYMGEKDTKVEAAWRLYLLLKEVFVELPIEIRKQFMKLFFSKGRSDYGCTVFSHMWHLAGTMPDVESYTIAFRNIALAADSSGLFETHNLLKIDQHVEPTTEMYNSLMWAYNCTNWPTRALDVFKQITTTTEGPDSDTLSLVMISCGLIPGAALNKGAKIWSSFIKLGIKPTAHNYAMRITSHLMNQDYKMGFDIARNMEAKEGVRPDQTVLMALYAEVPPWYREAVQKWAKDNYPEEWAALENDPEKPLEKHRKEQDERMERSKDEYIFPADPW